MDAWAYPHIFDGILAAAAIDYAYSAPGTPAALNLRGTNRAVRGRFDTFLLYHITLTDTTVLTPSLRPLPATHYLVHSGHPPGTELCCDSPTCPWACATNALLDALEEETRILDFRESLANDCALFTYMPGLTLLNGRVMRRCESSEGGLFFPVFLDRRVFWSTQGRTLVNVPRGCRIYKFRWLSAMHRVPALELDASTSRDLEHVTFLYRAFTNQRYQRAVDGVPPPPYSRQLVDAFSPVLSEVVRRGGSVTFVGLECFAEPKTTARFLSRVCGLRLSEPPDINPDEIAALAEGTVDERYTESIHVIT